MERDPFTPEDRNPEKKWDLFEKPEEKDKEEEEKPKKKWFFEKEDTKAPANDEKKTEKETAKERNIDKLSPEEQKHALAKQYVANRAEQLREELATKEPGSAEAIEVSADLELIAALDEKLDNPDLEVDEAVEEAYQQIMERLDEILEMTAEASEEDLEEEPEPTDLTDETALNDVHSAIWKNPASNPPPRRAPASNTQVSRATSSTGGSTHQPRPTTQPNIQQRPETTPKQSIESPQEVRKKRAGSLAVSEALSQMLGRRYESPIEMAPAHPSENPERVINPIRRTIEEKERRVRKLAIEQVVSSPVAEVTPIIGGSTEATKYSANQMPYFEGNPIKLESVPSTPGSIAEVRPKPAAEQLVAKETNRNLQQASTGELLQIADKIKIDGTSLRSLYTNNKIDRNGLTKIIKEALKGGDVKRALSKATLGAEAQRGRAIEMRHDDPAFDGSNKSDASRDPTNTSTAAQQRTEQILQALKAVNQTTASQLGRTDIGQHTTQAGATNNKKLVGISVVAAIAVAITGLLAVVVFLL